MSKICRQMNLRFVAKIGPYRTYSFKTYFSWSNSMLHCFKYRLQFLIETLFKVKTFSLVLLSFVKSYILESKIHMHSYFVQRSKDRAVQHIFNISMPWTSKIYNLTSRWVFLRIQFGRYPCVFIQVTMDFDCRLPNSK